MSRYRGVAGYLCLTVLLALLIPLAGCAAPQQFPFCVEVLDVGQSDCTLIRQGDAVLLIDTGTATERSAVRGHLADRGIDRIDLLLLTHPHEDHIGNGRMLLETYPVGALLLSPYTVEELGYDLVLNTAEQRGVPQQIVQAGESYPLGEAWVEILFADAAMDANDASIVLRITYGDTVFLFTGDATETAEAALLANVPLEKLDCDFLKAGHHGSDLSTGEALLRATTPEHVAISCGWQNSYGFPGEALLERLSVVGAEWHRTDTEGCLRYVSDGQRVSFVPAESIGGSFGGK